MNTNATTKKDFWQEVRGSARRTCGRVLMTGLVLAPLAAQAEQPFAWGANDYGQLGDGTTTQRLTPVEVSGLGVDTVAIAAGGLSVELQFGFDNGHHGLALKSDGTVWSWGDNSVGQLGDGTLEPRLTPALVPGLSNILAISAGGGNSLAIQTDGIAFDGSVWAWGRINTSSEPQRIAGLDQVNAVAAGGLHALALKSDGTVWAWGGNLYGQLGDGTITSRSEPAQVHGLSDVIGIAAGSFHSLAVDARGKVWAWGRNHCGQLGDGGTTLRKVPVAIDGISGTVLGIAASAGPKSNEAVEGDHSLAFTAEGRVWSWGCNDAGQLGFGFPTTRQSEVPTLVPYVVGVEAIAAGGGHSLALRSDGTVQAWGYSLGLGDGSTEDRGTPRLVPGLTAATRIAAGPFHSLALAKVVLRLSPSSLAFGDQAAGADSASKSIAVSNPGTEDLVLSDIEIVGDHPADFAVSSETCSAGPVAPGGECRIEVRCQPTALGARSAALQFKNNGATFDRQVPLSCNGIKTVGDLSISLGDSPDPVKRGANLTYTVTVQYRGAGSGNGQMNLNLPEGVSLVSASMSQGSCLYPAPAATGTVSCSTGNIASGGSATFRIVTKVGVRGKSTLRATASVTASGFTEDTNSSNNSAAVGTIVFGSRK